MGRLTAHVLDTSRGQPAAGLRIVLDRKEQGNLVTIREAVTNADGRCDGPLLEGPDFLPGIYRLVFHAGSYFDRQGLELPAPKFFDEIVIQFGIAESDQHYHVPLLLSPYGYSTYRGS